MSIWQNGWFISCTQVYGGWNCLKTPISKTLLWEVEPFFPPTQFGGGNGHWIMPLSHNTVPNWGMGRLKSLNLEMMHSPHKLTFEWRSLFLLNLLHKAPFLKEEALSFRWKVIPPTREHVQGTKTMTLFFFFSFHSSFWEHICPQLVPYGGMGEGRRTHHIGWRTI